LREESLDRDDTYARLDLLCHDQVCEGHRNIMQVREVSVLERVLEEGRNASERPSHW
jgi:hypothetical protein